MATYRISQLAEHAGVPATTLRYYEQAGLLPAQRSESGYRLYDDAAVERLGFISSGKHLGLPLEEIRDLLGVWEDGMCTDVRAQLRPMVLARIADAGQRAAELDAFTDRLRRALEEIDGPERPGRCDPGCGFLRHHHQAAPVPVVLSPRRPHAAGPGEAGRGCEEEVPIACTLTGGDQAARIEQWRQLLDGATRERIEGGLRLGLAASLAGPVAELATAEQRCCAFFDFTLRLTGARLHLDVRAPAEAAPLLADVFGTTA